MKKILVLFTLWTALFNASTEPSPGTQSCFKPDDQSKCGKVLFSGDHIHSSSYNYFCFPAEKAGTCRRANVDCEGSWSANAENPDDLAPCFCEDKVCTECTEGKKAADVASCCGKGQPVFSYFGQWYFGAATAAKDGCCLADLYGSDGVISSQCFCKSEVTECFTATTSGPTTPPPTTPVPTSLPPTALTTGPSDTTSITIPATTPIPTTTPSAAPTTTIPTTIPVTTPTTAPITTPTTTPNPTTTPIPTTIPATTPTTTPVLTTTPIITTTAIVATTTLPPPLCPAIPNTRIIGGTETDACVGVVRFDDTDHVYCNGVYAFHPNMEDSTKAKLDKPVVFVPTLCLKSLELGLQFRKDKIVMTIGEETIPYNPDDITFYTLDNAYFSGLTLNSYTGDCLNPAGCTYDHNTMSDAIDKADCFLLTYGSDSISDKAEPTFSGKLSKVGVKFAGSTCQDAAGPSAECFTEVNNGDVYACTGDFGAPVFCNLNTGEAVLYGVIGQTSHCGPDEKTFPVVAIFKKARGR